MLPHGVLRGNVVLVVGLTVPVLILAGLLLGSRLGDPPPDPPAYDVILAVWTPAGPGNPSVAAQFFVSDGELRVRFTPYERSRRPGGQRLFRYDAGTQAVRELPFEVPADVTTLPNVLEQPVRATRGLRLDPSRQSPDGYEVTTGLTGRSGLLTDVFLDTPQRPRLQKDGASVPLMIPVRENAVHVGPVEFLGWVVDPP